MQFYLILRYFATKGRENANLKREEFLFFQKNKKRKTTKKEEMVICFKTSLFFQKYILIISLFGKIKLIRGTLNVS